MFKIKNIKIRKSLVFGLKLLLFVVVSYFFYQQITKLTLTQFQLLSAKNPFYFFIIILLLFINWFFELWKWYYVLNINKISYSFNQLFSSYFSGVTTGVITPNRLGNFIGRMIFFKGKVRTQLILGTLYSNFSQFIATILFGVFSFIFLGEIIFDNYGNNLFYVALILSFVSVVLYFLVPYLKLNNFRVFNRKFNILRNFQIQSKDLMFPLLFLSMGRYLAFSFQYFFFFLAFDVPPSLLLLSGIFMFYLISTLIPSVFLGKLVVRETVGLLILSYFIENSAVIVVSSLLLWLINLGIPSIIGLIFILRKKYFTNA